MIAFKIINNFELKVKPNCNAQSVFLYSDKLGLYNIYINNLTDAIKTKIDKINNKTIYMSLKDYNELSLDKKNSLKIIYDLDSYSEVAYKEGFSFEFDCRISENIDISLDKPINYYQFFLAGFLDSNKSYTILDDYANSKYRYFILSILDMFSFKYYMLNISGYNYIVIKNSNILCKYIN